MMRTLSVTVPLLLGSLSLCWAQLVPGWKYLVFETVHLTVTNLMKMKLRKNRCF